MTALVIKSVPKVYEIPAASVMPAAIVQGLLMNFFSAFWLTKYPSLPPRDVFVSLSLSMSSLKKHFVRFSCGESSFR